MSDPRAPHFVHPQATILFVEDNPQVRSLLSSVLVEAQFEVLSASTAKDALLLAVKQPGPIHLMISDLILPDGSGIDVANKFRTMQPEAAVMFISGYGSEDIRSRGIDPDQIYILHKPFSMAQFVEHVRAILKPILAGKNDE